MPAASAEAPTANPVNHPGNDTAAQLGDNSDSSPKLPCLSLAASEQTDPARLLELALSCYEAEQYAASLTLLERLRAIDPNPVVLFNLGAAHAALGHCADARRHYQDYIEQTQSETGKADAREQLDTLQGCVDAPLLPGSTALAATAPAANPSQAPTHPAVMVMRQPQPVSEQNPYAGLEMTTEPPSRVASWILLGSGAALLVASGGFAYASQRAEQSASEGGSGDAVAASQEDGQRYNTLAWACAGGALALATSGLLLIAFEPSSEVAAASNNSSTKFPKAGAWTLSLQHQF